MCLFVCWLLAVARLQCTWDHTKTVILWDHTKTVILTGVSVCVLACMLVGLLWVDSSVSEITQKQWFSEITQKQWFFTGLSVCLLVGLLWLGSSASEIIQTIFGQILWDHWKKIQWLPKCWAQVTSWCDFYQHNLAHLSRPILQHEQWMNKNPRWFRVPRGHICAQLCGDYHKPLQP